MRERQARCQDLRNKLEKLVTQSTAENVALLLLQQLNSAKDARGRSELAQQRGQAILSGYGS